MSELFTVVIVRDFQSRLSGLTLRAGAKYTARQGGRAGHYHLLINGEWFCVNADLCSVLH